jgi:AraC-like DNA-binding protein
MGMLNVLLGLCATGNARVNHIVQPRRLEKPDNPVARNPGPARGLLREVPASNSFQHARIAPTLGLHDWVQHYWVVRWDLRGLPAQSRQTLPHPNLHWVMTAGESLLHGVHSGRFGKVLADRGSVFGVKFRPGAVRAISGRSVSGLRNRTVDAALLWGRDAQAVMAELFAHDGDDAHMVDIANAFLGARCAEMDRQGRLAASILDAIAAEPGLMRVDQLCTRFDLGERSLQRLFQRDVGIGAKWVINRFRLHEALARIDSGESVDWAALALQLGYFDQAHFIRDFTSAIGHSPLRYGKQDSIRLP